MVIPERRKVGKYEILRKLGRGGMADVYLAQDTEHQRTVALKVIEHGPDADSRETIEAERRGSELQAKLAEIDARGVKIFDAGDMDGYFVVAMEYGRHGGRVPGAGYRTPAHGGAKGDRARAGCRLDHL